MKRVGRQLMALGFLGFVIMIVVSVSGPGPELRQQIGIVGGLRRAMSGRRKPPTDRRKPEGQELVVERTSSSNRASAARPRRA